MVPGEKLITCRLELVVAEPSPRFVGYRSKHPGKRILKHQNHRFIEENVDAYVQDTVGLPGWLRTVCGGSPDLFQLSAGGSRLVIRLVELDLTVRSGRWRLLVLR